MGLNEAFPIMPEMPAQDTQDPVAIINGEAHPLEEGAPFAFTVLNMARQAGFGKFKLTLNGTEIKNPNDAPETVQAGHYVQIAPYDEGGI